MIIRGIDTHRSATLIIYKLLAVKPGEQVAIVCDPHTEMEMVKVGKVNYYNNHSRQWSEHAHVRI